MLKNTPEVERENCSVVFKYLSRSLVQKGMSAGGVIPAGSFYFCKDDVAVILLLGVSFMFKYRALIFKLLRTPKPDEFRTGRQAA
jgi:hypothetical protein